MERVLAELGELVEVDEMVEERWRMDAARILIRTKRRPGIETAVPAVIDGVDVVLHVVEDMHGFGMKTNFKQPITCFPPSPLSTEPNTPVTHAGQTPGADIDGASMDGGSDGSDGGYSRHWRHIQPVHVGRDHRTQPIDSYHLDWAVADKDDVAQSNRDNKFVEDKSPQVPSNGHLFQEGKPLNALPHSGSCVDMQMEKVNHNPKVVVEEQKEEVIEVAEVDQKQKGLVALSGAKAGNLEGEKQKKELLRKA